MIALLPFVVPALGATAVVLTARRPAVATAIGWLALLMTLGVAPAIGPEDALQLGGSAIVPTEYGRLVFGLLAASGSLLGAAAAAAGRGPSGMAAMLMALPAAWLALAVADPAIGTWAVLGGSVAALACTPLLHRSPGAVGALAAAVRAVVVAGVAGVVGLGLVARAAAVPVPDATVGGLAFVLVAGGLALRMAAVPLHGWAARLADAVSLPALAAGLAWLPAVLVGVILVWADASITPIAADLGVERGLIVAVALASVALGSMAAWLVDDLGHVVAYLAIATLGLALLGIAALDPVSWAPTRSWIAMAAVALTGLAGWAAATEGAYRTRWLPDLRGWARRSPVLAVAYVVLALAMVGVPGLAVLDVRMALVDGAIEGPLAVVARACLVAPLVPLLRVLLAGLSVPGPVVRDGRSERPRAPERWAGVGATTLTDRIRAAATDLAVIWRLDRIPAASAVVLLAALLAGLVSAGGFELAAAAAGPAPAIEGPVGAEPSEPPPGESPSEELAPSAEPTPGESTPTDSVPPGDAVPPSP